MPGTSGAINAAMDVGIHERPHGAQALQRRCRTGFEPAPRRRRRNTLR
jgi:hypothetical protein